LGEQTSINSGDIIHNQQKIGELGECMNRIVNSLTSCFDALAQRIVDLEEGIPPILERLHALEEKERARARDEHARDVLE